MPSRSKAINIISARLPGIAKQVVFGSRSAPSPKITASGAMVRNPCSSLNCKAFARAFQITCSLSAASSAAARPAMPATFSVPERRRRSWPPPSDQRCGFGSAFAKSQRQRPLDRRTYERRKKAHRRRQGRQEEGGQSPVRHRRRQVAPLTFVRKATSDNGWMTPVSLFAACTATMAGETNAFSKASRSQNAVRRSRYGVNTSSGKAMPLQNARMFDR